MLLHGVFQQLHRDLHRHDLAVAYVILDHRPEFAVRPVLLRPEEVPRAQVLEPVVAHQVRALRALARAGAAQHEDDGDVFGVEGGGVLRGG